MPKIDRRGFLLGGAATLALGSLPLRARMALADQIAQEGRNLVIVLAKGGWDTTGCLDPKAGNENIDSPSGHVRMFGDSPILTGEDRPAVTEFFQDFGEYTAVVNGVGVRSIAHEACMLRIMTGTPFDNKPDFGAVVGEHLGQGLAVPYMILGPTAFPGPYAGSTGRAGSAGQLLTLLHHRAAYSRFVGDEGSDRFVGSRSQEGLIRRFVKRRAEADRVKRSRNGLNRTKMDDLVGSIDRREKLRPLINDLQGLSTQLEFVPQIELGLKVLKGGISRAVLVEDTNSWDTHANNDEQQVYLYQSFFSGLNALMRGLMQEGLFENTTVVVLSEMSRTPKLNDEGGKDHWPVTSAMVISPYVHGGRTFGGTDDHFQPIPVHMNTGEVDENGTGIAAPAFVGGLLTLLGVDPSPYTGTVAPFTAFVRT